MQNLEVRMFSLGGCGISVTFLALHRVAVLECPENLSQVSVLACYCRSISKFQIEGGSSLQLDVTEVHVGNVSNEYPSHFENAFPLVGRPHSAAPRVVDLYSALEYSTLNSSQILNIQVSTFLPYHRSVR